MRLAGEGLWMPLGEPSAEAYAQARAGDEHWVAQLPGHLAAARNLLAGHDAFDVLGGILLLQTAQRELPPAHRNTFLDGLIAGEIAAMVLLERPGRLSTEAPTASLYDAIVAAVGELEALTKRIETVLSGAWTRGPGDSFSSVHGRFISNYVYAPINETDEQARGWMRELFEDPEIDGWLVRNLGFGATEAEKLVDAAYTLIVGRGQEPVKIEPGVGQLFSLSAAELARSAGETTEAANAFCGLLSQPFGQLPRSWPALPTPMRHRPMLDDGCGEYMIAAPPLLRRGLRYSLAAALNPALAAPVAGEKHVYTRYLERRSKLLEVRGIAPLERFLRPTVTYRNLWFRVRGAEPCEGEIDGVLLIDGTAIVIQAKSAPTRIDAVAGDADEFKKALHPIVTEAMRQHDDARVALCARRDTVEFWEMVNGHRVNVEIPDLSGVEILPVTLTLEDLSGCASLSWELPDAALATGGELPWIVGVTPLEMMIWLLDFDAQLIQFLRRRSLLNESRNLDAADEIDIFLEYLHNWLDVVYAPSEQDGVRMMLLPPARFTELDDWLRAQWLGDMNVQPPRQVLNDGLRALLTKLEHDRPSGWLEVSVALLDCSAQARKQIGASARRMLAGKQRKTVGTTADVTPTGEKLAIMLLGESNRTPIEDARATEECLDKARAHGQTKLIALVVPLDGSVSMRIVWHGAVH
jgi:hypothetical protein